MRPSEALALNRDKVVEIIARYPVTNPRIFGSVARGEDVEGSDIDILVDRNGSVSLFDLAKLEIELEGILGVPIGVHTPGEFGPAASRRINADQRRL
jgi:predicted nucleotidyltransferase